MSKLFTSSFIIFLGLCLSALVYALDGGKNSVLYWGLLPGLPFVLIGFYGLWLHVDIRYKKQERKALSFWSGLTLER